MKESKYQDHFDKIDQLINEIRDEAAKPYGTSVGRWCISLLTSQVKTEAEELEEIIKKLERENIGLKQTNLNQQEKLEKYFNGIK